MLKIGVIGIGNAGNQVADLAKRNSIDGIAINTSEKDISTLTDVESIIIGDEKGAGKDRNIAKEFIKVAIKNLLDQKQFINIIEQNEIIFVVSSTGGGTGSGMSPVMVDILTNVYPSKRFILVGILPPIKESIAAQQNTIEYLQETRQLENIRYMLYDNNNYSNMPVSSMLSTVNLEIVEDIKVIRGDYQTPTPYNSIDEKDMMKIIETSGRILIIRTTGMKEKDIDECGIEENLINTLKNRSAHAEIDHDQIVKRLGLIINLNDKVYKTMDTNLLELKSLVGEPIEGFEHIAINNDNESTNRVIIILSGLSVPDDRIEKIMQRITDATTALTRTKESSVLDSFEVGLIESLRGTEPENNKEKEINLDDIFSKYLK